MTNTTASVTATRERRIILPGGWIVSWPVCIHDYRTYTNGVFCVYCGDELHVVPDNRGTSR